jgi:alkylhydroperoxidase family enzyme
VVGDPVLHGARAGGAGVHRVGDASARDHVPAEAYEAVAAHFNEDEIAALLSLIVAINAWNALAVSTRAWTPGSYEP